VTFNYPGATSTTANGVNNGSVIVGSWTDSAGAVHGYRYANGKFTKINFPGAKTTSANGINDYGDIVGYYIANGGTAAHGFLLHNGSFKTIDVPGSQGTNAMGINKYGTIVGGTWVNGDHGFVDRGGSFKLYDAPSNAGPDTALNGISNLGAMVDQVFSYDDWRGFLVAGSDVDFKAPRAALDNQAYGVNGRGDVVGCGDGGNGWLALNPEGGETESTEVSSWKTQSIVVGGNTSTCPMSINYNRAIVGTVGTHGFLGVPQ
jgi:hypothetical protein